MTVGPGLVSDKPLVQVAYDSARYLAEMRGKPIRRQHIQTFMFGNLKPANGKTSLWQRGVFQNALDQLVAEGRLAPGAPEKVSDAKTGSGEVKFWHPLGRKPSFIDEEAIQVRRREMQLYVQTLRLPPMIRYERRPSRRRAAPVVRRAVTRA